jgi:pimeloyl-ACP methyl ester carboxylesterase
MAKVGVEVRHGLDTIVGRPIHYTETGHVSAKPLVFIHGSPGSSSQFIPYHTDSTLLAHFRIISIDRPGFGYSGFGEAQRSLDSQALQINRLLEHIKATSAILVGHSYGGPTIVRMAMLDTSIAAGLVVVGGSVAAELEPKEPWRKALNKKWLNWWMPKSFKVSNDEIFHLKKHLKNMQGDWKLIQCPVNVVHGEKDNLVTVENAKFMEEQLVNTRRFKGFIYPDLNHFIPFNQADTLKRAIFDLAQFLRVTTANEDQERTGS